MYVFKPLKTKDVKYSRIMIFHPVWTFRHKHNNSTVFFLHEGNKYKIKAVSSKQPSQSTCVGLCHEDVFRARIYMFEQFGVDGKLYVKVTIS